VVLPSLSLYLILSPPLSEASFFCRRARPATISDPLLSAFFAAGRLKTVV